MNDIEQHMIDAFDGARRQMRSYGFRQRYEQISARVADLLARAEELNLSDAGKRLLISSRRAARQDWLDAMDGR